MTSHGRNWDRADPPWANDVFRFAAAAVSRSRSPDRRGAAFASGLAFGVENSQRCEFAVSIQLGSRRRDRRSSSILKPSPPRRRLDRTRSDREGASL